MDNELLKEVFTIAKQNGLKVFINEQYKDSPKWCYISDGEKIAYVEEQRFGLNFSSVHKPCHKFGTGFATDREVNYPTIQHINAALNRYSSFSLFNDEYKSIKKYVSIDEFLKKQLCFSTYIEV